MAVLTKRQHEVLQFLRTFQRERGFCPSFEEIASGVGLSSLATVHAHIANLEQKGFIRRGFNQGRSIEVRDLKPKKHRPLRPRPKPFRLMLRGRIAAGRPMEAIETAEEISLEDIARSRDVFVLQVKGDSMIDEHICDGDYVLVEKSKTANNGQIAVALIDGEEATLKRVYSEKGNVLRLQPANERLQPVRLPASRVQIQGCVIGVLRKY